MLHYVPTNSHLSGFCNDEAFEVDGSEIEKSDFDEILAKFGYNEYDIESLGYAEIVRLINADEFTCCEGLKEHSSWCRNK